MVQVNEKQVLKIQPNFSMATTGVRAVFAGVGRQLVKSVGQEIELMGKPVGDLPRRGHAVRRLRQTVSECLPGVVPEGLRRPRHLHTSTRQRSSTTCPSHRLLPHLSFHSEPGQWARAAPSGWFPRRKTTCPEIRADG